MKQCRHPFLLFVVGCACPLLLLTACGLEQKGISGPSSSLPTSASAAAPSSATQQPQPEVDAASSSATQPSQPEADLPVRTPREVLAEMLIDPPYDFDPAKMVASDFGGFFIDDYPVTRSEEKLLPGTPYETTLTVIKGQESGPVIFVVAGIHGNEAAGWSAGNLLANISIKGGTLCVLSPANALGAANSSRYVVDRLDLNRSFPGSPEGNPAEQLADAIFSQIENRKPSLLFDLHEATMTRNASDYLGSSLIYSQLEGMDDLFFELLLATQTGDLCSEPFAYYSPGPAGSINRTAAEQLSLPAITVETFRGYPLERRIADQLAVVQYALRYYNMV